uniref:Putative secreted protein n=1 Tax=Anopheles triannulatus TaxID=58253 RepID=A0A2M4B3D4_9DIPT
MGQSIAYVLAGCWIASSGIRSCANCAGHGNRPRGWGPDAAAAAAAAAAALPSTTHAPAHGPLRIGNGRQQV